MAQPVVHFEIVSDGAEELRGFYGQMFGWKFAEPMGPTGYTVIEREDEDAGIGGGIGDAPEGYGGHVTFYVDVPDVGAALDQAERLGGRRMMGPEQMPGAPVIGLFLDPRGNTVGLVSVASMG